MRLFVFNIVTSQGVQKGDIFSRLILTLAGPRCLLPTPGTGGGGGGGEPLTYLKNGSKYKVKIWYTYYPTYLGCKSKKDLIC